jgi:intraflagellar transport protein 140
LGHCTEVQSLSSAVDKMLFYEEKSRLVIITRSLLLTQYHVSEDGRVTRVMQVKLSVAKDVADSGIRSVVWAGPGLLAIATSEKMVRLLDLSTDESYNLSLSSVRDGVDKNDRVVAVAFSPVDRYLAVGTHMGMVVVWKYSSLRKKSAGVEEDEEATSPGMAISQSDWEVLLHIYFLQFIYYTILPCHFNYMELTFCLCYSCITAPLSILRCEAFSGAAARAR